MTPKSLFEWLKNNRQKGSSAILLVPSGLWMRELPRRIAARGDDAFGLRALTPLECARWISEHELLGEGLLPLGQTAGVVLAREIARQDLAQDPFGHDARQRPGFASVLAEAIATLRCGGVSPADLAAAAESAPEHRRERLRALALLFERWESLKTDQRRFDDTDLLTRAVRHLEAGSGLPEPAWGVALVGHHFLSGLQKAFVDTLARVAGAHIPSFHEPFVADAPRDDALGRAQSNLFAPAPYVSKGPFDDSLGLLPCPGETGEVQEAIRSVLDRAADGVPLSRQALLVSSSSPYGDLIPDAAEACQADVPLDIHVGTSLLHSGPGRALAGLVALIDTDMPARDVFELMTNGMLGYRKHPSFIDALPDAEERKIGAGSLQAIARAARVIGGNDWGRLLEREASALLDKAVEQEAAGKEEAVARLRRKARAARALSAVVVALTEDLGAIPPFASLSVFGEAIAKLYEHWVPWVDDKPLASAFLAELKRLPTGESETRTDALRIILGALARRPAPCHSQPGGLLVADISDAAGLGFDSTVVMGLAERQYPPPPSADPLLPDDVRAALGLPGSAARADHRRAQFGAACRAVSGTLRVTWSAVESNESRPRVPSSFALAIEEAVLGRFQEEHERQAIMRLGADPTHSLTEAEHWSARLLGARNSSERHRERSLLAERHPMMRPTLDLAWQRWGTKLTSWDGIVTPELAARALAERAKGIPSVTKLERYASCPMKFFFETLLRVGGCQDSCRLNRVA